MKSIFFISKFSLLTVLTLPGSIYLLFLGLPLLTEGRFAHTPDIAMVVIFILALLIITLFGGALWGYGVALLMKKEIKPLLKTGAISWGIAVLLAGFALYFSQLIPSTLNVFGSQIRIPIHAIFTVNFMIAIGIAAWFCTGQVTNSMGFGHLKKDVARISGMAGAAGFLFTSLIVYFGLGWKVGSPYPGKYSMITIMHLCNSGAGFCVGMAMSWFLLRSGAVSDLPEDQITIDNASGLKFE